jgi:hypothetical protein
MAMEQRFSDEQKIELGAVESAPNVFEGSITFIELRKTFTCCPPKVIKQHLTQHRSTTRRADVRKK